MPVSANRLTPPGGFDLSTVTAVPPAAPNELTFKLPEPAPEKIDMAVFLDAGTIDLWVYFLIEELKEAGVSQWVIAAQFDLLDPINDPGLRSVDVPAGATHVYFREEGVVTATTETLAAFAVESVQRTL